MPLVHAARSHGCIITVKTTTEEKRTCGAFAEAGLPTYDVTSWNGLLVPAGTPRALVNRISHDIEKVLQMPAVQEKLANVGAEPAYADPKEFAAIIKADIERFKKVIKEAHIRQVN